MSVSKIFEVCICKIVLYFNEDVAVEKLELCAV